MKKCSKCKEEKELECFSNSKSSKDRLYPYCRECSVLVNKKYKEDKKHLLAEKRKIYVSNNKEEISKSKKEWEVKNKENLIEKRKIYLKNNKDKVSKRNKEWREKNKEHNKKYKKAHLPIENKRKREQRKTDTLFALKDRLRGRVSASFRLKKYKKTSRTHEIIGAEWCVVKTHIERQFSKGMNWVNRSEWHIDHIIPLASAKTEEELINLCHYTNLQPLWAKDNLEKSDKIIEGTQNNLRL